MSHYTVYVSGVLIKATVFVPPAGGVGVVIEQPGGEVIEVSGVTRKQVVEAQLELCGVITALRDLPESDVLIYTKGHYVPEMMATSYDRWSGRNWKTPDGKDHEFATLWRKFDRLINEHVGKVTVEQMGQNQLAGNGKLADQLAYNKASVNFYD